MSGVFRRLPAFSLLFLIAVPALAANGGRHVLVKFAVPVTPAIRADLARDGLTLGKPVAGGGYVALVRPGANFQNDSRLASIEPLAAQQKIHRSATREAARPKLVARFNVFFHDDVTLDEARAAIDDAGGSTNALQLRFLFGHRLIAN